MLSQFSDDDVRHLSEAVAHSLAQSRASRPSWNSRINVTVALIAIISIFISVGVYWSRIGAMEKREDVLELRMDKYDEALKSLDLRVLTQSGDARVINVKLDAIQRDIEVLKGRPSR